MSQDDQITGTIVKINSGATGIVIDDGETDGGAYLWFDRETKYGTKPKIGERVTVHYEFRAVKCMLLRWKRLARPIKLAKRNEGERKRFRDSRKRATI